MPRRRPTRFAFARGFALPPALALALALALAFALALALVLAGSFASVARAAGPIVARLYRNDSLHIRAFEPPPSWQPAPQANYPRILVAYSHPDGGRLTLAAQKTAAGATAEEVARQAKAGLEKQGFSDVKIAIDRDSGPTPHALLDAKLEGGRRFLKQLYVVDGGLAYVVSLVAGRVNQPEMAKDFDWSVRSLQLGSLPAADAPHLDSDGGVPR